jgi:phosphocarrier protein FPr
LKLTLTGALHARPANLFVRVAASFVAVVEVRKGDRRADAKNILEVLTLGAGCGDEIELTAAGADAQAAIAALGTLVERNFDADLVPETGHAGASGIAVGPALVWEASAPLATAGVEDPGASAEGAVAGAPHESSARLAGVFSQVDRDLKTMVSALAPDEAALFEPEIALVQALEAPVMARVLRGESFAVVLSDLLLGSSVSSRSTPGKSDLLLDARERLLDASDPSRSTFARRLSEGPQGEVVLVAHDLTPSLVAALPRRVVGIVAALGESEESAAGVGDASHAAILARGRGLPLLFVAHHVANAIAEGDAIVLDTRPSPPRLWTSPSEARVAEAKTALRDAWRLRREAETTARPSLVHLPALGRAPFAVRANVGSIHDYVPLASDGVGLVRTELLHAASLRAPILEDQLATLALVVGKASTGPVVVRLFDGGGDKPIAWLPAPPEAPGARGIDLLARYPKLLRIQVDAIARAAAHADVRLLLPLTRDASDIEGVRALAPPTLAIGAMIETPEAVRAAPEIAAAADFVCIGTNDLTAAVRGEDRTRVASAPLDPRVLAMIAEIVKAAHLAGKSVTVCGEMAGDIEGAKVLVGLGVDAISVAPARLVDVKMGLAAMSAASCVEALERVMKNERATP